MGKSNVILGTVCLALAATVILQWLELHRQAPLPTHPAAKVDSATEPSTLVHEIRSPPGTVSATPEVGADAPSEWPTDLATDGNTAFRAAMTDYQQIALSQQYAALIARLRLSPEQADRFTQLLAEEMTGAIADRVPLDYTEQRWAGGEDEPLRAILTQTQIDAFRHFQQTTETRQQVEMLRNELMASAEPLRDDQIAPLVDALHTEEMRLHSETRDHNAAASETEDARRESEDYFLEREGAAIDRELAAARAILSREQIRALKRQLEARRALGIAGAKLVRLDRERQLE